MAARKKTTKLNAETRPRKSPKGRSLIERRRDPSAAVRFVATPTVAARVPRATLERYLAAYLETGLLNGYFEHGGEPYWVSGPWTAGNPTTVWTIDDTPASGN
jgi:hypothetical protein